MSAALASEPEPAPDISSLVRASQQGDRSAFAELYRQYARPVHGILLARVPVSVVEDLVQDVFLRAMQQMASLRDPAAFGGWLAAIARHRAADYLRRTPKVTELTDQADYAAPDRTEPLAILAAIRTLSDAYRETLILRLVEGMTGPEIAARTGLTPASVRVNLHRGMKMLRERLERRSS